MKKLFEACHNYDKTMDGSYFKLLREASTFSFEEMASRFIIEGTKWQPSAQEITALENGKFTGWHPDLGYSVVKAFDIPVFELHGLMNVTVPSKKLKAAEAKAEDLCVSLGFKFTKTSKKDGTCRYRITHPATKLFYDHDDIGRILSAILAAVKDHKSQGASKPESKKTVTPFDPFDL